MEVDELVSKRKLIEEIENTIIPIYYGGYMDWQRHGGAQQCKDDIIRLIYDFRSEKEVTNK